MVEPATNNKVKDVDFEILAFQNLSQNVQIPTMGDLAGKALVPAIPLLVGLYFIASALFRLIRRIPLDNLAFIFGFGLLALGIWLIIPAFKKYQALQKLKIWQTRTKR